MKRRTLFSAPLAAAAVPAANVRARWADTLDRIARPVFENLARGELKKRMPLRAGRPEWAAQRAPYATLEAFGRTACGIAPWLALDDVPAAERPLQDRYRAWARDALAHAVDPASPDYMAFPTPGQSLVDAAFLALALLRHPAWYRDAAPATQRHIRAAMEQSRATMPGFNNWLLFSAMVETFLQSIGAPWDRMRVDYALRQHEQWYKGDGVFGDGPDFHWNYYNSYVIQPFLTAILDRLAPEVPAWRPFAQRAAKIALRYAAVQERLIAPDGAFPVLGRSSCYRTGAFHHLADQSLRARLPFAPAAARGALTAVIDRMFPPRSPNFDRDGWLEIGFQGRQPAMADNYINTGSLYLCTFILLPLGLPASAPFWAAADEPWTSVRLWRGDDVAGDHALTAAALAGTGDRGL